jgi:threonine dehydratase
VVRLRIEVPDRPGVLATISQLIAEAGGNIVDVTHHRDLPGVALKRAILELSVETRDRTHADDIGQLLETHGFRVTSDAS